MGGRVDGMGVAEVDGRGMGLKAGVDGMAAGLTGWGGGG